METYQEVIQQMPSNNLFGQYYNNLGKNKTYTNVDYKCSSATSGENTLVFRESEAQLLDSNGNIVGSIDLSKIGAGPMTSWTSGSIVINPGEVKLIEGLEYGKQYKHVYFEVPHVYISSLEEHWKRLVNVKFTILLNVGLDLREYDVTTTVSTEDNTLIEKRIQNLLNEIGAEDNIEVSVEEIEDEHGNLKTYILFKSLVLGYDFIITDFSFFNHRIIASDKYEMVEDQISDGLLEEIRDHEDDITFGDETSFEDVHALAGDNGLDAAGTEVGHYDNQDVPSDPQSADHYYVGDAPDFEYGDNGNQGGNVIDPEEDDNSDGNIPGSEDDDTILNSMSFSVDRDKYLEVHAFKYPNGAARAWIVVPEWPVSLDEKYLSLKLNHVKDSVIIFDPTESEECFGLYEKKEVDVYASERNEKERHNLKEFKYWMGDNFAYMDSENGSVVEVNHAKDTCECPNLKLEIHNPHIGMYRYLDYVTMNDLWTNVGAFYGLVTNEDIYDDEDSKNLANSIFLYNMNDFPVKVAYFICS